MKRLPYLIILLLSLALGFMLFSQKLIPSGKKVITEDKNILLEKIEAVTKLITVEGYFSEIYDYKDYYHFDIAPFQKKALLRVKAKVAVGYDMTDLTVTIDEGAQRIEITIPAEPILLSIDHDLDYYDLSEGAFNSFSESDLNKIQDNAKSMIKEVAKGSDLMQSARDQKDQIVEMIALLANPYDYKVVVKHPEEETKLQN